MNDTDRAHSTSPRLDARSSVSPAQAAVERAAARLMLPDEPPWVLPALENVTAFAAALWREQQVEPSRGELSAMLERLCADMDVIRQRLSGTAMLSDGLLPLLLPDTARELLKQLAGRGQADALDRLGYPTPKLIIACGVAGVHRELRGKPPGKRNQHARALCGALLWRTLERAGASATLLDQSWEAALRAARQLYAMRVVGLLGECEDYTMPGPLARYAVSTSIRKARLRWGGLNTPRFSVNSLPLRSVAGRPYSWLP